MNRYATPDEIARAALFLACDDSSFTTGSAIFVDGAGLTYRGIMHTEHLSFQDIRNVDVLPGPVTVYAIRGKGHFVHFTSFFKHHRRLMHLLVERAGLSPNRS